MKRNRNGISLFLKRKIAFFETENHWPYICCSWICLFSVDFYYVQIMVSLCTLSNHQQGYGRGQKNDGIYSGSMDCAIDLCIEFSQCVMGAMLRPNASKTHIVD